MRARRVTVTALSTLAAAVGVAPLQAHAATGTTVYVDNANAQCSDTAATAGAQATPFCTIEAAATAAVPGETVLVEPGTGHYAGASDIRTSGTQGSPITYLAAPGTFAIDSGQFGFGLNDGVHDVVIQGFTIALAPGVGSEYPGGVWIAPDNQRVSVLGNTIVGRPNTAQANGTSGIIVGCGDAIDIKGNTVTGGQEGIWACGSGVTYGPQPPVPTPLRIEGNTVTGIQPGVDKSGAIIVDGTSVVVTGNTVQGNGVAGIVLGTNTSLNGDAVDSTTDNLVYGNAGGGIVASGYSQHIVGNTVADNNGAQVAVTKSVQSQQGAGPLPPMVIENNVIATGTALPVTAFADPQPPVGISVDPSESAVTSVDYNVVDIAGHAPYQVGTTVYPDAAHFAATGQAAHDVNASPLLTSTGTLSAGSPAIDSADSGAVDEPATDFAGNARRDDSGVCDTGAGSSTFYDRGAFEFQGTTSPAVPCSAPPAAVAAPAGPTISSVDFPASGPYFGVGRPGTFRIAGATAGSTVHYAFDNGAQASATADASGGLTVPYTASAAGTHWLDAQVVTSGGTSLTTRYVFKVTTTDAVVGPTAYAVVTAGSTKRTVSVDATRSLHGTTPIGSYLIEFGDGATASGSSLVRSGSHVYQADGVYPVKVTIVDTDGLVSTATYSYSTLTGQATAATPPPASTTEYVNGGAAGCSDTQAGAGSQGMPFCTVTAAAAAAVPGETIDVAAGTYNENPLVTRSGSPDAPVVLNGSPGAVLQGINLKNVHDVTVSGFTFSNGSGVAASGQNLTFSHNTVNSIANAYSGNVYAVAFTGVDNGVISGNTIQNLDNSGISVDGTSGNVMVSGNSVAGSFGVPAETGISVAGTLSTVVDNRISKQYTAGINVAAGADTSVVANNMVTCTSYGEGITDGASYTAITSNTVMQPGNDEIHVVGAVTHVTVENNIATEPDNTFDCGTPNGGDIGLTGVSVDDQAMAGTTIDHNDVYTGPFVMYHWNDKDYYQLSAFQHDSGQSAYDTDGWAKLDTTGVPQEGSAAIDSADSGAPGEQTKDLLGNVWYDDPATANTGIGPVAYADRGAIEFQGTATQPPSGGGNPPPPPGGGNPPPPPGGGNPPPTGSPTPVPTGNQPTVSRIFGEDRYGTSVHVSQAQWKDGAADAVVLAKGMNFPDALSGVPLAAHVHGPLLLTDTAALDSATSAEIFRVLGGDKSKTVYILGGTGAVSQGVEDAIRHLGYQVKRYGGADRYATALQIAQSFGPTRHVIVATGENFADALSAGPLGAAEDAPIVLSQDTVLDPQTAAFVESHAAIEAVGNQAVRAVSGVGVSGKTFTPLAGQDRYETSSMVAGQVATALGHAVTGAGVASGLTFPDALTGGAYAAIAGEPLLLTAPDALPDAVGKTLAAMAPHLATVTVFGGPKAVSPSVESEIATRINGRLEG